MLNRVLNPPPTRLYPTDGWRIIESQYTERYFGRAETVFALSNGYIGVRGTFDEGRPARAPGAFLNGFHETWPIVHAEEAYGLARTGQTIVNVPDATVLRLYVDDEPLFIPTADLGRYSRVLDMRAGTLSRDVVWLTAAGREVAVRSSRLVSLEHRHVVAILYEVTLPHDAAPLTISSLLLNREDVHLRREPGRRPIDPRRAQPFQERALNSEVTHAEDERMLVGYRTTNSGMTLGVGVQHVVDAPGAGPMDVTLEGDVGEAVLTVNAQPGVPVRIVKYITYQSSRSAPPAELVDRCARTLDRVVGEGYEALLASQRRQLDRFWERADVCVDTGQASSNRTQQAVRWNLFQLAQATWRTEGAGVPAKGLTGQAYEGHYFWDTEIYLIPFLVYTQPRIARNLLRFRASMLPYARERACELGLRGALFPWRTINGEEASAYYQAGTAQYHIDADVAHAVQRYVNVCGDDGFLFDKGAEVLVETARMWEDLGFHADDGRFHIHSVTGPDEYTTVVNDNAYTNLMARLNLRVAAATMRRLERERPEVHHAIEDELGVTPEEVEDWERAAETMYVPYDERRAINPQDANFLERERWPFERTPPEHYPLLLHYHPLTIYRYQVIKQADVVLAMFLLGDQFSDEVKRANFEYYDALTTGDSSLSAAIQSIVAAEVGNEERALEYFRFALLMDLADIAGNVSDGVHIASAGGAWQALVFGFGGVRDFDGRLSISPRLPAGWRALQFSLHFQGRQLRVELTHERQRVVLEDGGPLELTVDGEPARLVPGQPLERFTPSAVRA